jgi:ABC-2 type transport system permease protein
VRLYVEVAKRAFARHTTYRAANLAGLATNAFFGILRTYLFIGLYAGRDVEAGWTLQDAIAFVWIGQALITPLHIWVDSEIAETIRSGDVVSDLSKPFDYYFFWLARDAGRAAFSIIFRGVPTIIPGMVLFDVRLPLDPMLWLMFATSVVLAIWISFGLRFIVNISSFWLMDHRGLGITLMFATTFFSGFLVPLNYWPDAARAVVVWLPFAGIVQAPMELILGKASGGEIAAVLVFQIVWAVTLMLLGRALLTQAVRRVVTQGG